MQLVHKVCVMVGQGRERQESDIGVQLVHKVCVMVGQGREWQESDIGVQLVHKVCVMVGQGCVCFRRVTLGCSLYTRYV